ncbi:MAG TPA: hypothetical protein VEL07_14055 [Planctomycetota bacterium]|nr:hypothetical protein [Planctomycetota bacterium]
MELPDPLLQLASGRSVEVIAQAAALRALTEVLKAGDVVSARVVDRFATGDYLFALRGRTLVAQSAIALALDSVVAFEVLPDDGGTVRLRLAQPPAGAAPGAQAPAPASVGLPDDAPARAVLDAFAAAGAPLERDRMHAAWRALTSAAPEAAPRIAAAHAAVARVALPATPAVIALAERAVDGPPRLAAAMAHAQAIAVASPPVAAPRAPTAPMAPMAPTTVPSTPTAAPVAGMAAPPPTATSSPPASAAAPIAANLLAHLLPRVPDVGRDGVRAVMAALGQMGVVSDDGAAPLARATLPASVDPATRPAQAVDGALHERAQSPAPERLLPRLAEIVRALADQAAPEARTTGAAVVAAMREAAAETVLKPPRLADYDVVLPLPLSAHGEATPARLAIARRATASGVVATFLRADVELSRLGPVSARISAIVGGPLTITVVADARGRAALAPGLDALEADLASRGSPARVRLIDPDEAGDG